MQGRSRYYKHQIMAHPRFGDVVIIKPKDELTIVIPQRYVTKTGSIYKRVQNSLNNEDYERLANYSGIKVYYKI